MGCGRCWLVSRIANRLRSGCIPEPGREVKGEVGAESGGIEGGEVVDLLQKRQWGETRVTESKCFVIQNQSI